MEIELIDWQERLERHFSELQNHRSASAPTQPIFALEHGLADHEIEALKKSIQKHILSHRPCWNHRLPWIVYASELGYLYSGHEYWQTFEKSTPGWENYGDRYCLRRYFQDFHICYGGAKPSGPWARHFSIICWPITHAILPQDLQRHLAKILFNLRHVFTFETLESPRRLGEHIAVQSLNTPTRFQQLAQEPLFLGQIAAALLKHGHQINIPLIIPPTLERIAKDLDRERQARTWIRGARDSARIHFLRGIGQKRGRESDTGSDKKAENLYADLGLEPRLILRPSNADIWDVFLELPDLSYIPVRFPQFKDVFANSRCRIVSSLLHPGNWLLYGSHRILLEKWPQSSEPLIEFDPPSTDLNNLLKNQFLLRPGPIRLFKIASDGLAYELQSTYVRAGEKYILLFENDQVIKTHPSLSKATLRCEGIKAVALNLPETLQSDLLEILKALNIHQAGTVHIWPAGLTPAKWNGEGAVEWLTTDTPCIGVCADYQVDTFYFELGLRTLEISPDSPGSPVYIEIPTLDRGSHILKVEACKGNSETGKELAILNIKIREPQVWIPGKSSQGALFVIVDPSAPTLEQLWEDQVSIELHGPISKNIKCSISFLKKGALMTFFSKQLPAIQFPVSNTDWQRYFYRHFKEHRDVQNEYDLADSCTLSIDAGELGAFRLFVEREFTPLRWAVHRKRRRYLLQLLDDSGAESQVQMQYYTFQKPDIGCPLDIHTLNHKGGFEAAGGLYVAQIDKYQRAVLLPPEVKTLNDLQIEPQLSPRKRSADDLYKIIKVLDLWEGARLTGNLLSMKLRLDALSKLLQEIFRLICGEHWAMVEHEDRPGNGAQILRSFKSNLSSKSNECDIATKISEKSSELANLISIDRVERLTEFAKYTLPQHLRRKGMDNRKDENGPSDLAWLSEFVLRLASCSKNIADWAGDNLFETTSRLLEIPSLARLARFMVLVIAHEQESNLLISRNLYEGWDWK